MTKWKIYNEDAVGWARNYQKGKFHALLCDAPYHLTSIVKRFGKKNSAPAKEGTDGVFQRASSGFMGQQWDGGDLAFRPETWEAFGEVLYPGAFGMAFSASRNWHRMAVAIEDAGFILHPTIFLWATGQGFPKATNIAANIYKHIDRWMSDMYNDWEESICQITVNNVEQNLEDTNLIYPLEDFVVVNASISTKKTLLRDLRVIIAELNSPEVNLLLEIQHNTVQENAGQNTKRMKLPVNGVEKYLEPPTAFLNNLSALSNVTIYQCENLLNKIKEGEALKIGLGSLLSSKETITNVSYVELIDTLKRIILNQSKTFQNLDTKSQMDLLPAITVIITKSTMGCLTSSMGDIVKERTHNWEGHRYGLQALKPAVEPIIVFQKPYEGKPLDNIVSSGAGALNIEGGRIPTQKVESLGGGAYSKNSKRSSLSGDNRSDSGKGMFADGKNTGQEFVEPSGRWPSNLILEWEAAHALDAQTGIGDSGGASRFFYQVQTQLEENDPVYYCAKVSPAERNAGLDGRNVHPTLKPIDLCKYLATLLLPPAEYTPRRIFIPFSGSGSEMIGAGLAGWEHVVGVEFDKENGYVDIAEKRLEHWLK